MKNIYILFLALLSICISCSDKSENLPDNMGGIDKKNNFSYTIKNGIQNEVVSIISHTSSNKINIIDIIKYGEISQLIKIKKNGNYINFAFRVSSKEYKDETYFETSEFYYDGNKDSLNILLCIDEYGKYISKLIE